MDHSFNKRTNLKKNNNNIAIKSYFEFEYHKKHDLSLNLGLRMIQKTFKAINLLLVFVIAASNLVTLCPENKGRSAEVHFAVEPCDAHECHRNQDTHQCDREVCEHKFCNDTTLLDEFRIPQLGKFTFTTFVPDVPFSKTFFTKPFLAENLTITSPQRLFSSILPLSTVLRI